MISSYEILLLLHVLLFAYWLGADLGVLYAARFAADAGSSLETRQTISRIMAFVDLAPRLSVPLVGATGVSMAVLSGAFEIRRIWIWVAWFAAIIWVCSNLYIYLHRADRSRIQPVLRFDAWWRAILLVVAAGAAIAALLGAGITSDTALALKLLLFALAVALSLVLRALFKPYRPALQRIATGGDNAIESAVMASALARARPIVFLIWLLVITAAAVGLWGS
ncbi:MAG: hypothetical protein U1F31_13415 [Steroidobacteraceae bacterium]|jgi:hypothetical protein